MQPVIYIHGYEDYANYCAALRAAGAVPALTSEGVPFGRCAALLLPGGGDIAPDGLDDEETAVIRAFIDAGKPILGICRGMQALNVYFGGTLFADIPGHRVTGIDMIHPTAAEGPVAELFGSAPVVNSTHHQAVDRLGDGLVICQRAPDGIVEAFYHASLPILGVQWHPERMSFALRRPDAADAEPLIRAFVAQAQSAPDGR